MSARLRIRNRVACRYDSCVFDHQHYGSALGTRAMHNPPWNNKSLSRRNLDRAVFKVNQQLTFNDVEELVVFVMPMPVIFPLHHAEADYRIIYLAESLVVPPELASVRESLLAD